MSDDKELGDDTYQKNTEKLKNDILNRINFTFFSQKDVKMQILA